MGGSFQSKNSQINGQSIEEEKSYRLLLNGCGKKVSGDLLPGQVDNSPQAEDTGCKKNGVMHIRDTRYTQWCDTKD